MKQINPARWSKLVAFWREQQVQMDNYIEYMIMPFCDSGEDSSALREASVNQWMIAKQSLEACVKSKTPPLQNAAHNFRHDVAMVFPFQSLQYGTPLVTR